MLNNLPVLYSDTPACTLCAICPEPGFCCRAFGLEDNTGGPTYWLDELPAAAECDLRESGLPFTVASISAVHTDENGRQYVTCRYNCPHLTTSGRCSIYADRPEACRNYQPGSDPICVLSKKANPPSPLPDPPVQSDDDGLEIREASPSISRRELAARERELRKRLAAENTFDLD